MTYAGLSQALASGVLQGGFLALAASGFSLIFGVQRILNVAQGAFTVLAAYITIQFSIVLTPQLHLDPIASIPLDFALLAVFGGALYLLVIRRVEGKGFEAPLLVTFGISLLMEYAFANGLGPIPAIDPSGGLVATAASQGYASQSLRLGAVYLPEGEVIAFGIALAAIPLMQLLLARTYDGRAIRATAQDPEAAEFSGIDTSKYRLLSFMLGSGMAGVAGALLALTGSVTPTSGETFLLPIIIIVVVLGGLGSLWGTLAGGVFVGVVANLSGYLALSLPISSGFHADLGNLVMYSIFIGVLLLRPSGLFGKEERF